MLNQTKENNNIVNNTVQPVVTTESNFEIAEATSMQNIPAYQQQLRNLKEVQDMTSEIDISNTNTILQFGQKPSEALSKITDELAATTKRVNAQEASAMIIQLTKIMDKFDIKEFENPEEVKGLKKLFVKARNRLDELFAKYDDMGKEVDGVYTILKQYEQQIYKAQNDLKKMYEANIEFYEQLEKYIVAGEIALEEIEQERARMLSSTTLSDFDKQNKGQQLDMLKNMLEQRVYDLRIAENVAIQTAPMIRNMAIANFNLQRKINSSFIITLPVFKQCMIQAIMLKRQEIQANSIQQLDNKTNELLLRNAQNTATQSVKIAKMAEGSSIEVETLKKTYQTILTGIEETKQIQLEQAEKRKNDTVELERIKQEAKDKGLVTSSSI